MPDPDATGRLDVGWREWLTLPDLAIPVIKAKVDTGARTSALHAWRIEPFEHGGAPWIRFHLHPIQRTRRLSIVRTAPVHDRRIVTDSGGHRERRYVISTRLLIGSHARRIELTLTDRDTMLFRMLVGRKGMRGLCILPDQSYLTAPPLSQRAAAANYRAEAEERPRR